MIDVKNIIASSLEHAKNGDFEAVLAVRSSAGELSVDTDGILAAILSDQGSPDSAEPIIASWGDSEQWTGTQLYAQAITDLSKLSQDDQENIHYEWMMTEELRAARDKIGATLIEAVKRGISFPGAYPIIHDFIRSYDRDKSIEVLLHGIEKHPRSVSLLKCILTRYNGANANELRQQWCDTLLLVDGSEESKQYSVALQVEIQVRSENWKGLCTSIESWFEQWPDYVPLAYMKLYIIARYLSDEDPEVIELPEHGYELLSLADLCVKCHQSQPEDMESTLVSWSQDNAQHLIDYMDPVIVHNEPLDDLYISFDTLLIPILRMATTIAAKGGKTITWVEQLFNADELVDAKNFEEVKRWCDAQPAILSFRIKAVTWVTSHPDCTSNDLLTVGELVLGAWSPMLYAMDTWPILGAWDEKGFPEFPDNLILEFFDWLEGLPDNNHHNTFKAHFAFKQDDWGIDVVKRDRPQEYINLFSKVHVVLVDERPYFRMAYLAHDIDEQKAKEFYQLEIQDSPECFAAYFNLSLIHEKEGNIREAVKCINTAITLGCDDEKYQSRAASLKEKLSIQDRVAPLLNDNPDGSSPHPVDIDSADDFSLFVLTVMLAGLQVNYSSELKPITMANGLLFPTPEFSDFALDAVTDSGLVLIDRYSRTGSYTITNKGLSYNPSEVAWVVNAYSQSLPHVPIYDACKQVLTDRLSANKEFKVWLWREILAHELFEYTRFRMENVGWPLEFNHRAKEVMLSVLSQFSYRKSMAVVYSSVGNSLHYAIQKGLHKSHAINMAVKNIESRAEKAVEEHWRMKSFDLKQELISHASNVFCLCAEDVGGAYFDEIPGYL